MTNDCVTIACDIELEDAFENIGAQLVKEAVTKTNDVAGDGATTATALAQAMITEGLRNMAAGANPTLLKRGIDKGVEVVVEELKRLSKSVNTAEETAQVAAVSSGGESIGEMISEVMCTAADGGVITVEESQGLRLEQEYVEVMQIDRGYVLAYMVTNAERMELENVNITMMGQARRVTATKDNTTIVNGKGSQDAIEARMKQIHAQIEDTISDVNREKLHERLAKLADGVTIIKVGAPTEVELKEKMQSIEDALSATRTAVEEGIVVGGGTALVNALLALDKLELDGDERIGVEILRRALEEPLRQIAFNAGAEGSVVVATVKGFDARTGEYTDMFKAGIIDPAKVTRSGLRNAASLAGMLLRRRRRIRLCLRAVGWAASPLRAAGAPGVRGSGTSGAAAPRRGGGASDASMLRPAWPPCSSRAAWWWRAAGQALGPPLSCGRSPWAGRWGVWPSTSSPCSDPRCG